MSVSLHLGDSLAILPTLAAQSVDSCVTDPPYHLTTGKRGGSGEASVNLNSPAGRARVTRGFMGKKWDGGDIAFRPEFWAEVLRTLKPGGYLLAFGGTRTYHRLACAIEDAGFEIRDQIGWAFGQGFPKSHNLDGEHEGWGSALKPAWEPICMARKPLEKGTTIAENVAAWGTGAINIDGCRVPGETPSAEYRAKGKAPASCVPGSYGDGHAIQNRITPERWLEARPGEMLGRWPANLAHDGSEEVLAAFPQAPGQLADAKIDPEGRKTNGVYGTMKRGHEASANSVNGGSVGFQMRPGARRADAGSAARFFYQAKASRSDREAGLREAVTDDGRSISIDNPYLRGETKRLNTHTTVKPTDLMRWLCRLVTPKRGLVLDPFMGSGSTGRAAVLESFRFTGIEAEAEYMQIAKARIADVDCI